MSRRNTRAARRRRKQEAMEPRFWSLQASPGAIREEEFEGVEHVVVPVVALVQGVIQCATCPDPELVLASEFGKQVEMWNGRPVTMNHPHINGTFVSANDPKVLETFQIGTLFNASVADDKLHAELWVNTDLVEKVGKTAEDTLERIENGEQVEVSTGYFADGVRSNGKFEGERYAAIQRDIKPDHMAILENGSEGACNWDMGCGTPRVNACACGGVCGGSGECNTEPVGTNAVTDTVVIPSVPDIDERDHFLAHKHTEILPNISGMSDVDLRTALAIALDKDMTDFFFITAVFDDKVVFESFDSMGPQERSFSVSEAGEVSLGDDITNVRPVTTFVPAQQEEILDMDRKELVSRLIANSSTRFEESHREWLESLDDAQFDALTPNEAEPEPESKPTPEPVEAPELTREQLDAAAAAQGLEVAEPATEPKTVEQWINTAPVETRDWVADLHQKAVDARNAMIERVLANEVVPYEREELEAMSHKELSRADAHVAANQAKPDYSLSHPAATPKEDENAPAPVVNLAAQFKALHS